jgi:putative ABC transport system ATP-binding protein
VARAIVGRPKLILADEPTGNLDTAMANDIMDLLEKVNESGTTLVMVTHDPDLARRASRQIHLLDGSLIDLKIQDSHVPLINAVPAELSTADC